MNTFYTYDLHSGVVELDEYGLPGKLEGERFRLLEAVGERIHALWKQSSELLSQIDSEISTVEENGNKDMYKLDLGYGALIRGKIEFLPYTMVVLGSTHWSVDVLAASAVDSAIVVVVPRAGPLPLWSLLLRVFPPALWAAVAAAGAAWALAWRAVAGESLAASAAAALRAFSSCGGAPQDRVRATPQRLQLAGPLLASGIVLVALYQGHMFTLMADPPHLAEINTFEQLANSKILVLALSFKDRLVFIFPRLLGLSAEETAHRIKASNLPQRFTDWHELSLLARRNERFAVILKEDQFSELAACDSSWEKYRPMDTKLHSTMELLITRKSNGVDIDPLGSPDLNVRSPCLKGRVVRRNWPFAEEVNSLLGQMNAAGLQPHWRRDFQRKRRLLCRTLRPWLPQAGTCSTSAEGSAQTRSLALDVARSQPLGLAHAAPPLQLLAAGLLLAAALCAAEWRRGQRRGRRRGRGRQGAPHAAAK
ncbi:uncharacterized protein GBIM_18080 [Gryllus bimaculatus]|nr:uncharacterized protein GBIM_18080 [Gryllus bimaculatus]